MLKPDVVVEVVFYKTTEGGRHLPTPEDFFNCPFEINGAKHDGRLILDQIGSIHPGEFKSNVPVKFLAPELVMSKITIGQKFYLWDMGYIGEGKVLEILE